MAWTVRYGTVATSSLVITALPGSIIRLNNCKWTTETNDRVKEAQAAGLIPLPEMLTATGQGQPAGVGEFDMRPQVQQYMDACILTEYLEFGNEPPQNTWIQGDSTHNPAYGYMAQLKNCAPIIRARGVKVMLAATAGGNAVQIPFFQQVTASLAWPSVDAVAIHPYPAINGGTANAANVLSQVQEIRSWLDSHGHAALPIFITEVGWGSNDTSGVYNRWNIGPADPTGQYPVNRPTREAGQANQLEALFNLLATNAEANKLRGIYWFGTDDYGLRKPTAAEQTANGDARPIDTGSFGFMGLTRSLVEHPAQTAFQRRKPAFQRAINQGPGRGIPDAPPVGQTVFADQVAATTARLRGWVNPRGLFTTYYFQFEPTDVVLPPTDIDRTADHDATAEILVTAGGEWDRTDIATTGGGGGGGVPTFPTDYTYANDYEADSDFTLVSPSAWVHDTWRTAGPQDSGALSATYGITRQTQGGEGCVRIVTTGASPANFVAGACSCPRMKFEPISYGEGADFWFGGSFWVPTGVTLNDSRLLSMHGLDAGPGQVAWLLTLDTDPTTGQVRVAARNRTSPKIENILVAPTAIPRDQWVDYDVHVLFSKTPGVARTTLYRNGTQLGATNSTDWNWLPSGAPMTGYQGGLPFYDANNGAQTIYFDKPRIT